MLSTFPTRSFKYINHSYFNVSIWQGYIWVWFCWLPYLLTVRCFHSLLCLFIFFIECWTLLYNRRRQRYGMHTENGSAASCFRSLLWGIELIHSGVQLGLGFVVAVLAFRASQVQIPVVVPCAWDGAGVLKGFLSVCTPLLAFWNIESISLHTFSSSPAVD